MNNKIKSKLLIGATVLVALILILIVVNKSESSLSNTNEEMVKSNVYVKEINMEENTEIGRRAKISVNKYKDKKSINIEDYNENEKIIIVSLGQVVETDIKTYATSTSDNMLQVKVETIKTKERKSKYVNEVYITNAKNIEYDKFD